MLPQEVLRAWCIASLLNYEHRPITDMQVPTPGALDDSVSAAALLLNVMPVQEGLHILQQQPRHRPAVCSGLLQQPEHVPPAARALAARKVGT